MNEVELLNIGKRCRFLFDTGDRAQKSVEGKYLGFQIIGGTTFISFEYETKKGDKAKFVTNTHHLYGFEFIDSDVVTAAPNDNDDVSDSAAASDSSVIVRKRGPGRPRIVDVTTTSAAAAAAATDSNSAQPVVASLGNAPVRRGPGRPPNSAKTTVATAVTTADSANSTIPVKRGPGRPRKNPLANATPTPAPTVEEVDDIDEGTDTAAATAAGDDTKATNAYPAPTPTQEKVTVVSTSTDSRDSSVDEVVKAATPTTGTVLFSASGDDDDDDEVVPAKTPAVPRRPANSLARASRIPDEVDGDL